MKAPTLIELLILVAIGGIVFSVVSQGIETYRDNHANDSKPVIEFHDTSKVKVVPQ